MATATPVYQLPIPAASDPADVPADMGRLANRIEAVFGPGSAPGQIPVWDNTNKKWIVAAKAPDAELLDGLDSSAFLRTTGKAADSELLDGIDSAGFLRTTGKAADAELLDGQDSTAYQTRNEKAAVNGYASLGADGKVPAGQLPAAAATVPALVTALPVGPANGAECVYTNSLTAPTYYWHLKFNSSTGKWHYVGGSPLYAEVVAREGSVSTTYAALATAGPAIAVPLAGDYEVAHGAFMFNDQYPQTLFMSYDIGGTAAVDGDSVRYERGAGGGGPNAHSDMRARRKTLPVATLTAKYKTTGGPAVQEWADRWMRVTPVTVS